VPQCRRGLGLPPKPLGNLFVFDELGANELDGHGPLQLEFLREIDLPHAAGPEQAFDPESPVNDLADVRGGQPVHWVVSQETSRDPVPKGHSPCASPQRTITAPS
jgi:hypothetical protein